MVQEYIKKYYNLKVFKGLDLKKKSLIIIQKLFKQKTKQKT